MSQNASKAVTVSVSLDPGIWKGLQFEAKLMSAVFNHQFHPEDIIRTAVERRRLPASEPTK